MKKNATLSIAVIELLSSSEKDVAVIAPSVGPRIFDLVVGYRVKRTKADSKNAMVEIGTTIGSKNPRFVELKVGLVSLNGDRERLTRESREEGIIIRRSNIDEGRYFRAIDRMTSIETGAGSLGLSRDIRIIVFGAKTAVFVNPIKGIIHKTAITTVVASTIFKIITIDELLFRERDKFAEFVKEDTF